MKKVIYYEDMKGKKPVKEFINDLDDKTKAKTMARIIFLGEHWHEIRRPFADSIGDKLYELRVRFSSYNIRVFYTYMFKDHIVLLHAFNKKMSAIPTADKLKAMNRMLDFQARHEEGKIKLS